MSDIKRILSIVKEAAEKAKLEISWAADIRKNHMGTMEYTENTLEVIDADIFISALTRAIQEEGDRERIPDTHETDYHRQLNDEARRKLDLTDQLPHGEK